MELNSNLVINRLGFTHDGPTGESVKAPHDSNPTYTASRLGLTLVRQDQPDVAAEQFVPMPDTPHAGEALDSRLGISPDSEPSQGGVKVRKPFWPRFRKAAASLAVAVKKGILGNMAPRPTEHPEAPHAFVSSDPIGSPATKTGGNQPETVYRKGTFKMPAEMLARLKAFATANHTYQYSLVMDSVGKSLASRGFPAEAEGEDSPE